MLNAGQDLVQGHQDAVTSKHALEWSGHVSVTMDSFEDLPVRISDLSVGTGLIVPVTLDVDSPYLDALHRSIRPLPYKEWQTTYANDTTRFTKRPCHSSRTPTATDTSMLCIRGSSLSYWRKPVLS